MNKKYLFVAEADKIQDIVFRSSKLREVTGGSQMLEEFCEDTSRQLAEKFCGNVLISSGGSFRILFDSKEKAEGFGEYLSELYRRKFDSTITIAELVEVTDEKKAIEQAQSNLRKAKHSGKLPVSIEQMPYMAICASCGISIARYYKKRHDDEKENYFCEICEKKLKSRDNIREKFLSKFYSHIINGGQNNIDFPEDADTIAKLESRNYVAYIVADVNNMGVIFSSCDSFEKLKGLSDGLSTVIQQSLAEPTKILIQKQIKDFIPVLPLIIGGDDVFTLIPAQWSLSFTLCFCQEFENKMKESLNNIGIANNVFPTISVSVIICKGKFPYLIAHNLGEEMLKVAKRFSKEREKSTISFTVITGNELVKAPVEERKFIAGYPAYSIEELKKLIEFRLRLKDLPGTRRAQLESLFYKSEELQNESGKTAFEIMESEWLPEREGILKRLEKTQREKVSRALKELGNPNEKHHWLEIRNSYYHKLPDLLLAWDVTFDIEKDLSEYEEVKE